MNAFTGGQYSLFRVLLGGYLVVHFVMLAPWAAELFSHQGMLADGALSPLFAILPSPLWLSESPTMVTLLVACGALAGAALAVGWHDRSAALAALLVLAWLFARNPLIANPALPYLGWLLAAHLCTPTAPWGSLSGAGRGDPRGGWRMPRAIWVAAWVVLALSYSYSGYTKLLSPSWVSGDTVALVLDNPLARDHALNTFALALPPVVLQGLTWFILVIELVFAPLALSRRLRPWLWGGMLLVQFGFLVFLDFADLTFPMLLFHLFTFDPRWVQARGRAPVTLLYDGVCGFCVGVVRWVVSEDHRGHVHFRSLQAEGRDLGSFILRLDDGTELQKGRAVRELLLRLGGIWGVAGGVLWLLPSAWLDAGYNLVGRWRYRIGGRTPGSCPLVPDDLRGRFVSG